jgi:hypothetical protein
MLCLVDIFLEAQTQPSFTRLDLDLRSATTLSPVDLSDSDLYIVHFFDNVSGTQCTIRDIISSAHERVIITFREI